MLPKRGEKEEELKVSLRDYLFASKYIKLMPFLVKNEHQIKFSFKNINQKKMKNDIPAITLDIIFILFKRKVI